MGTRHNVSLMILLFSISIGLMIIGSIIFVNVFNANYFPQGRKEEGELYIIQGEIHYNFPSTIDEDGYNETLNYTYVPFIIGEGWESIYHVEGDVRNDYEKNDLVILKTNWEEGKNESDQIWRISHYSPPHLIFSLSTFLILLGFFLMLIPIIMIFFKTHFRIKAMVNYFWPLLLFFPSYYYGIITYDLCIVFITGAILLTIFPVLFFNILIMKKSEKKAKYSFFYLIINGPISILIGFSSGLVLRTMYYNFSP